MQSDICATEKNIGMHKNKIMKKGAMNYVEV